MAASNWDSFAVDLTGACDGSFAAARGDVSVEIYKNWLYVLSPSIWTEGSGFGEPTIAEIKEGELKIGNISILARRGPSNGVYCCLSEHVFDYNKSGAVRLPTVVRVMAGIGIYGFVDEEWVGVTEEHRSFLDRMIREGVSDYALPQEFLELDLQQGRRFNQGDVFFAGAFGIETPTAEVGDPGEPLFEDALKGLEARLDNPNDPIHEGLVRPLREAMFGKSPDEDVTGKDVVSEDGTSEDATEENSESDEN